MWALLLLAGPWLCCGTLVFDPPTEDGILVREQDSANFTFFPDTPLTFHLSILHPTNADLVQPRDQIRVQSGENVTVTVRGLFVGKTAVVIRYRNKSGVDEKFEYYVGVKRTEISSTLTSAFFIVAAITGFLNNAFMGIQLDWRVILAILRKPTAPILGFVSQWVLMAPLAAGLGVAILSTPVQQFGLLCVGSCPGGDESNKWTLLLDGNLDLSITLTFFSNICALGMVPMWVYTLGKVFTDKIGEGGRSIKIPFTQILISLALAIAPAFIGMFIRHFKPHWAKKTRTAVKWTTFLLSVVVVPVAIYVNLYIFSLFTWRTVLAGMLLPYSGLALSFALGSLFKLGYSDSMTIAVETAVQDTGVAMFILRFGLPEPENDLVMVVPICCLLMTPIPIWCILLGRSVMKCVRRRQGEKDETEPKGTKETSKMATIDEEPSPFQTIVGAIKGLRNRKIGEKQIEETNEGMKANATQATLVSDTSVCMIQ